MSARELHANPPALWSPVIMISIHVTVTVAIRVERLDENLRDRFHFRFPAVRRAWPELITLRTSKALND
jgi:hypothetical protein